MAELVHWRGKRVNDLTCEEIDDLTHKEAIAALKECVKELREMQERNRATLREWRRVSEARLRR
jgi:hypothetical protein